MRPWPLLILALFTVSCASNGSPPGAGPGAPGTPAIPEGRPPRLDGILDDGEWDGAQDVALSSGGMLSLMRDGDRLYLALRMDNKYAEPTLFLGYEDEGRVAVCYAGATFGTASYLRDGKIWRREYGYSGLKSMREGVESQAEALRSAGWTGARGLHMGGRRAEFCVMIPPGGLRLAVVGDAPRGGHRAPHWPHNVADGTLERELLSGVAPEIMEFQPSTWAAVTIPPAAPRPAAAAGKPAPGGGPVLEGAWEVKSVRYVWDTGDALIDPALPGLFLFTGDRYSFAWHQGAEAQPDYAEPWKPTDEERVFSYNAIVVNAGQFALRGDSLVTWPFVAKTPEFEGGEAHFAWTVDADTLWLNGGPIWNRKGVPDPGAERFGIELRLERAR
ncbi:MAG: hypothetical protein R3C71_15745 [Candidatus Krumholzibacteriia bacterium]